MNNKLVKLLLILLVNLLIVTIFFFSGYKEEELIGIYTPINYYNNIDTICLEKNGVFNHRIYNKNNKLLIAYKGNWKLENGSEIHFVPFHLNLDHTFSDLSKIEYDTSGGWSGSLNSNNSYVYFCVGHDIEEYCYKKIK